MSQTKRFRTISRRSILVPLVILLIVSGLVPAQDSNLTTHKRAVIQRVVPVYPEVARRLQISGTVKILATVAPNGSVKSIETLGGHPLLILAAQEAVMHWKFATTPAETKEMIELQFNVR